MKHRICILFHICASLRLSLMIALIALLLVACRDRQPDIYRPIGSEPIEEPASLVEYFEALQQHGAQILLHSDEDEERLRVCRAIEELDRYARGERNDYPAYLLRDALNGIAFELGYIWNHNCEDHLLLKSGASFLFRLLEQAARFAPDVRTLADRTTEDGAVGLLYYHEWSYTMPLYSFLLYRRTEGGVGVLQIGEVGQTCIQKLFPLTDEEGRRYYLCSNHETELSFAQYLYEQVDGRPILRCHTTDFTGDEASDQAAIIFNPRTLRWDLCRKQGSYFHRIAGSRSLHLTLDGASSRFEIKNN